MRDRLFSGNGGAVREWNERSGRLCSTPEDKEQEMAEEQNEKGNGARRAGLMDKAGRS